MAQARVTIGEVNAHVPFTLGDTLVAGRSAHGRRPRRPSAGGGRTAGADRRGRRHRPARGRADPRRRDDPVRHRRHPRRRARPPPRQARPGHPLRSRQRRLRRPRRGRRRHQRVQGDRHRDHRDRRAVRHVATGGVGRPQPGASLALGRVHPRRACSAALGSLFAVNSAIEVDLTGQINGESAAGRTSGPSAARARSPAPRHVGLGPVDRGAAVHRPRRDVSRIVHRLPDGIVSTARADADLSSPSTASPTCAAVAVRTDGPPAGHRRPPPSRVTWRRPARLR